MLTPPISFNSSIFSSRSRWGTRFPFAFFARMTSRAAWSSSPVSTLPFFLYFFFVNAQFSLFSSSSSESSKTTFDVVFFAGFLLLPAWRPFFAPPLPFPRPPPPPRPPPRPPWTTRGMVGASRPRNDGDRGSNALVPLDFSESKKMENKKMEIQNASLEDSLGESTPLRQFSTNAVDPCL